MQTIENKKVIKSNAISNNDFKEQASHVLNTISSILEKSLGYYGSTSVVQDSIYGHFITKDGYSILKKIKFEDEVSSTLLTMIKEISRDLVREVGDGSTSSVVTANYLFKEIDKSMKDEKNILHRTPPQFIIKSLLLLQEKITDALKEKAVPITNENFDVLKNIATVSNNNDDNSGNIIYDIYKEIKDEGFVFLEKSHDEKDYFEIIDGMEISKGYIDKCFANQGDKFTCSFLNPYIIMVDDTLDDQDLDFFLKSFVGPIGQTMRPLVILAKNYTVEFANCFRINKAKNPGLQIALVDFKLNNYNDMEIFTDLAIYLNAKIINKRLPDIYETVKNEIYQQPSLIYNYMGNCEKFIATDITSQFIKGKGKEKDINDRIEYINQKIENVKLEESKRSIDNDVYKLEKRKASLRSKIARLFVGGTTDIEKETRKYLMEDAVFACKSALKYGYIPGCNLSICKVIDRIKKDENYDINYTAIEKELLSIIFNSFKDCFSSMMRNAYLDDKDIENIFDKCIEENKVYNLKYKEKDGIHNPFEDDKETSIINSVMTDIMILKSSFSIIGLLVTSNQFLTTMPNTINEY